MRRAAAARPPKFEVDARERRAAAARPPKFAIDARHPAH